MFSSDNSQVSYYQTANKQLEINCRAFKQQFERLKQKVSERKLSKSPTVTPGFLDNIKKSLEGYQKEHNYLKSLIKNRDGLYTEMKLERHVKDLQEKLKKVEKENERLNRINFFQKERNLQLNNDDLDEEYSKIKALVQKNIEKNEINLGLIEKNEEKMRSLKPLYEKLLGKIEPMKIFDSELFEQMELLKKKLKFIETSFSNNVKRMTLRIIELDKQLKALENEHFKRKTKLFKRNQQKRLIEMSHSEAVLTKYKSRTPTVEKLNRVDVSFFYKPSVSRLYNLI